MYPPLDELYVGRLGEPAKVNTFPPMVSVQVVPEPGYDETFPASKLRIKLPVTIGVTIAD
jgi:hypothetical protein